MLNRVIVSHSNNKVKALIMNKKRNSIAVITFNPIEGGKKLKHFPT